ncbi:transmembrane protein 180-like [Mercenaria mercenaria]|uniref:transmembrane protein 180-like n=1 Tax=Mercenaria mercenaria TaxID=6596 RepID=UPI00234F6A3D|nr:transmembrane protein 180-like [Mercenaria mercenaria]XP_053407504.1 transmembrane protein 180-like [Mercenaria mercenaria]
MHSHKTELFSIPVDIAYGSLALFQNIVHNVFLLYHVDIFVSVYKIDKTSFWIGEMIFLVWNSLNDPVFGWISDKRYLSAGKGKSFSASSIVLQRLEALLWTGPLFAVSFMGFWVQWAYPGLQFVICLCLYDGFLTMIDLHHAALLADLAISAETRTRLNSRASMFSILGSASVFLSYAVWNKDNLRSFRIFCAILTLVSLLGFLVMTRVLKQVFQKNMEKMDEVKNSLSLSNEGESDKHKLKSFVGELMTQTNFKWFAVMNLVQVFHCHFNSNFFPLFLENLLGNAISPGMGPFLIGISFVAPHFNNLYFLSLCRKYGVYAVIRILFCVKLALSIVMFLAGPNYLWLLCFFIASNRVFTEGTCKLLNLVISDLVDEDYVLHHRNQAVSALMFGTAALLSKPGQTLAPLIGTWLLAQQTGHDIFQTGQEFSSIKPLHSSEGSVVSDYRQGCFNLLVYVPVVCALTQLAVWSQFSLHGRRLQWVKSMREGTTHYV